MRRQEDHFGLAFLLIVVFFYIITPLACAPTQVRVHPRETPPEKTALQRPLQKKPPGRKPVR